MNDQSLKVTEAEVSNLLNQFVLPQDVYNAVLSSGRTQGPVPFRKPKKTEWIRVHPDVRFPVFLLKDDGDPTGGRENEYVVVPTVADALGTSLCRPCELVLVATSVGVSFVWPVVGPDPERPNAYHVSALEGASRARKQWVRVAANQAIGQYEIVTNPVEVKMPDPTWPEDLRAPFERVLKERGILTMEHPVVRRILTGASD